MRSTLLVSVAGLAALSSAMPSNYRCPDERTVCNIDTDAPICRCLEPGEQPAYGELPAEEARCILASRYDGNDACDEKTTSVPKPKPTTLAHPHPTPNYGPTSSFHTHSTSAAYSQQTHGPKPSDLVLSFWSYLVSHIPRPTHTGHPYGTHTKPGPKPRPTCIYEEPGDDTCMPIPRPHHVIQKYTSSSVSRSGHGSHGSASHSSYVPKTVSPGPYPTSEFTHKPHSPKKTSSSAPHPSYARRDLLNDEEKPPCRPGNPWCGFHSHPTYVPTGHSTSSYAPKHTPEYTSSVVVSSTYSSKSRHPPKLTFSHAPWLTYSSKGHSASSYAPKHTSQPAAIHPQEPPKYPHSTVSSHHSFSRWIITTLPAPPPPKDWSTIVVPTSSRHYTSPKHTSSSSAPYSYNTPKYSTSKPAHSYRYSPPKHTESPSYPQVTPEYTSSATTYPHSTPKYTTSSAHHPHHSTYPSPPKSTSVDPCKLCRDDNPLLPIWCDYIDCPAYHPTSTKKHAPSYPTAASQPRPYGPNPEPLPPCAGPEHLCPHPIDTPPRVPINPGCNPHDADWPDCIFSSHPGYHPTSTKKHVPSYPTVTSHPRPHGPSYPTITSHPEPYGPEPEPEPRRLPADCPDC